MSQGRDTDSLPPELQAVLTGTGSDHDIPYITCLESTENPSTTQLPNSPPQNRRSDAGQKSPEKHTATQIHLAPMPQKIHDPAYPSPIVTKFPEIPLRLIVVSELVVSPRTDEPSPNPSREKRKDKVVDNCHTNGKVDHVVLILRRDSLLSSYMSSPTTWFSGDNYKAQNLFYGESSRPKLKKKHKQAQLEFDSPGYIEITVDLDHCASITEACGLQT